MKSIKTQKSVNYWKWLCELKISLTNLTVNPASGYDILFYWMLVKLRRGLNYQCQFASNTYYNNTLGLFQVVAGFQYGQTPNQSEGFLNGIFGPCTWWMRALARLGEFLGRRRRRRRHLEAQVDILAGKLYLEFSNWILTHMRALRILIPEFTSTQNFDPDWSSIVIWPGEPFWKNCLVSKYSQN